MSKIKKACVSGVILFLIFLFSYNEAGATQPKLSIEEIAQTADIIFVGTVTGMPCRFNQKGNMIFTDVIFEDVRIAHISSDNVLQNKNTMILTFMGGTLGDVRYEVSDSPRFEIGQRYLIFAFDNGKSFSNPIVGGNQGLYKVMEDKETHVSYILNAWDKAIIGLDSAGAHPSKQGILEIRNGLAIPKASGKPELQLLAPPVPLERSSSVQIDSMQEGQFLLPLTLDNFVNYINNDALRVEAKKRVLRLGGKGSYIDKEGKVHELPSRRKDPSSLPLMSSRTEAVTAEGQLYYCSVRDLHIVMEQVPSDWWSYDENNYAMWHWNRYMDLFRHTEDDGSYGHNNGENEFCGWLTDEELYDIYDRNWGTAAGLTCLRFALGFGCTDIVESDICFNAAYDWTPSLDYFLDHNCLFYPQTVMHELGHTWGYMVGGEDETYDYAYPSVMHAGGHIVEDGWGIHTPDAQLVRLAYQDQTDVINITDVGVESYYATGGTYLRNSYTDKYLYRDDDLITFNHVTVENMSNHALSNVQLSFYLSTDKEITSADYYLGSYIWYSFPMDALGSYILQLQLPIRGIPTGSYYAGAIVQCDTSDDFPFNNSTYFFQYGTSWPVEIEIPRKLDYTAYGGPEADAGPDQVIEATGPTTPFTLTGGLAHPVSVNVSYSWKDERLNIVGEVPTITLSRPLRDDSYVFTLTVADEFDFTSSDTVSITIRDTTPPALTAPPDLMVQESDPLGTAVNLGKPTVSDICDPYPLVEKDAPALFALGVTIVTWQATDAWHNVSTAQQKVTVVPGSAGNQLTNLAKLIQYSAASGGVASDLQTSLLAKVSAAAAALARGNWNDVQVAIKVLQTLINEIKAQTGKKINPAIAAEIILRANRTIAALRG